MQLLVQLGAVAVITQMSDKLADSLEPTFSVRMRGDVVAPNPAQFRMDVRMRP